MLGDDLHRAVRAVLVKYAAPGKIPNLSNSSGGVEIMVDPDEGVLLYRMVTWDDIEVASEIRFKDISADPRKYLMSWEGEIIKLLEEHRKGREAHLGK
jgi:hypothetical protein